MTGRPRRRAVPGDAEVGARRYVEAVVVCSATVGAVAALYLFPYVTEDLRYPIGWDSAWYVARFRDVAHEGLDRIGTIRPAAALLFAVLAQATGRDALTLVALGPGLLAGVAGLAAAAMARAALGVGLSWIPVIAVLSWAGFGHNVMLDPRIDNLVNAGLLLAAFAVATGVAGSTVPPLRGAVALAGLFTAAGLAHWPTYLFGVAVHVSAVALWFVVTRRAPVEGQDEGRPAPGPLLWPVAVSGAAVGLGFLDLPASGWIGARLGEQAEALRTRFLARLGEGYRYLVVPLALAGSVVAARARPEPPASGGARRFFLALMATWVAATVAGGVAQVLGFPSAGARLLSFLYPMTVLAGVALWWVGGRSASGRGLPDRTAAIVLVALVAGAFVLLAASLRAGARPHVPVAGVEQTAAAGRYLRAVPRSEHVAFLFQDARGVAWKWAMVKAVLPPSELGRISAYFGSPEEYLAGRPARRESDASTGLAPPGAQAPAHEADIAIVLRQYDRKGFREALAAHPEREVAPGVLVLRGPAVRVPPGPVPMARATAGDIALVALVVTATLMASGLGWAAALLPPDPATRVALAPALGVASISLAALLWALAGLRLSGLPALGPLLLAAAPGWGLALARRARTRGDLPRGSFQPL